MERLVVLNIDSRYMQVVSATLGENSALEGIKLIGKREYSGFSGNSFINNGNFITEAKELITQTKISKDDKVCVGVASAFVKISVFNINKSFQKETTITKDIVNNLRDELVNQIKDEDFTVIGSTATYFKADNKVVEDIENMTCKTLSISYSIMLINNSFMNDVKSAFSSCGIENIEFVSQELSELISLFDANTRDSSVIIANIDDLTTTVATGRGDGILTISSAPLGTAYMESEIFSRLEFPDFKDAEKIIRQVHILQDARRQVYKMQYKDMTVDVPCDVAIGIIKSKLDEIAGFIQKTLNSIKFDIPPHIPVTLIGSNAYNIVGLEEYLKLKLNRKVKFLVLPSVKSMPELTASVCVLKLASKVVAINKQKIGFISKLKNIFKKKK